MPFFIPLQTAYDYRFQVLDNVSILRGNHLFKFGAEWNRTGVNQTFLGFGNGRIAFTSVDGFLNYAANGPGYVECADDVTNAPRRARPRAPAPPASTSPARWPSTSSRPASAG